MEPEQAKEVVPEEQPKLLPNDALVVMAILEEQNIPEYEPRVVHQLLDFTYSYVTQIVSDAKAYADHARKPTLDLDDIKLAADMVMERSFTEPPQRHELAEATEQCNSVPLPRVKRKNGLRLPPSAHCLIGRNYRLRKPPSIKATEAALESRKAKSVRKESSQLTKQQAKEQLNETPTDDLKVGDKTITGAKKSRKNKKKKDKIINTINEGSDQEAVSKATAKKHKKETRRLKVKNKKKNANKKKSDDALKKRSKKNSSNANKKKDKKISGGIEKKKTKKVVSDAIKKDVGKETLKREATKKVACKSKREFNK